MSKHISDGPAGRIQSPHLREADFWKKVRRLGRFLGALALGCELVHDLNESPCGEGEG